MNKKVKQSDWRQAMARRIDQQVKLVAAKKAAKKEGK